MTGYKIAVLLHEGEVLADTVNFIGIPCTRYAHSRYMEARAVDDERCPACERKATPPNLRVIEGGRK